MRKTLLIIIPIIIVGLFILLVTMQPKGPEENPIVTMEIKDYGTIKIELYPKYAFNTVANFVNLIENGFYNNNAITRVQKGFVIQAGGLKEPGYTIKGEFSENGYSKNTLKHTEGVISMARSNDPNSASGQFFIVLSDNASFSLDNKYAGFGKVIEGIDILHNIEKADLKLTSDGYSSMGFLDTDSYIYITDSTIDTKGYTYKVRKN